MRRLFIPPILLFCQMQRTCCKSNMVSYQRWNPSRRIQTKWSKRYDRRTSLSNILKFYFWNKRIRNLTLGYFKTIDLDDQHYNCPLSRLPVQVPSHGPAPQTYVLGGLFEVWHYLQYLLCIRHGEDPDRSPFWLGSILDSGKVRLEWLTQWPWLQNTAYWKKSTDSVTNFFPAVPTSEEKNISWITD